MSRFSTLSLTLALCLGALTAHAAPPAKRPITVEDLYSLPWINALELSPDGQSAAFVVKQPNMEANKSRMQIWLADLTKGEARQLTISTGSDFAPRWMSKTKLAFLSTRGGEPQIYALDLRGGDAVQLTNLPVPVSNFTVAPDGVHAAVVADVFPDCKTMACNKERGEAQDKAPTKARVYSKLFYRIWDTWRDERRGHVLWLSLDDKKSEPRDLTPGALQTPPLDLGGEMDLDISPNGKEVAFVANATDNPAWNTNNDVFVVSVDGGAPVNITADNPANDAEPFYSPDGKYLAYLAMKRPGFEADRRVLMLYRRDAGKRLELTDGLDSSVNGYAWRPNSAEIVFAVYERGREPLYKVSVPSGITTRVVAEHFNTQPAFAFGGDKLLFLQQSVSGPNELYLAGNDGKAPTRVTRVTEPVLAPLALGALEDFEFAGGGGDKVHGVLVKPPGWSAAKKYPLLVLIHGGPQGAFGDEFHPRWNLQMFASPGFVVAAINFHGSMGYGQAFCDAVSGDWGGKPYEDIMKGVDYLLENNAYLDKNNVSAAGASYGAYMINWLLGHTTRFRSFVSHDGVYDLTSMYGATEELWFPEWEYKGTPWSNREMYTKFSPSSFAENFKTPTLVVHGENDYRVPYTQGLQLFTALQRQGVESKLLLYPDENHFVQKPENARLWWHTMLGWLSSHASLKWTPPKPAAPKAAPVAAPAKAASPVPQKPAAH